MKKKILILIPVLLLCIVIAFVAFLSLGRAGGEIGFDATVLSVDGTMITAKVTNDEASFFSKKLPRTIIFDASISGNTDLNIGDEIGGCYLKGSIEGEYVCVVSLDVNSND